MVNSKKAWVADLWFQSSERGAWTPRFSKRLNDWEIEIVELMQAKVVNEEGDIK